MFKILLGRPIFAVCVALLSANAMSAPQTIPQISGMRIVGQPILVFDHLKDKKEPLELPDTQTYAWKESDGTVNVTISHFENYRMRGSDIEHLTSDPKKIFSSKSNASDTVESHYNYHHWLAAPYTLDGKTIYALAHSEWYACLLKDDCSKPSAANPAFSKGNQMNSWANTLTSFKSVDGGASWALNGANDAHVVAKEGYTWTGTPAFISGIYHNALNHSGLVTPSRIVKEGNYYYSIGFLNHRDFSRLDSKTDQAPVDKYGFELIRTTDFTRPFGWEAWVSGDRYVPIANGGYNTFRPKKNGVNLNAAQTQLIYDIKAKVFVAIFTLYGSPGPIFYMTTPSLANPAWSDATEIIGTATFQVDPRSPRPNAACNKGFAASNYVSLIDSHSAGLNFEFTDGDPWLFYVVNPVGCGGGNLARDLYRAQLVIDYK
jgi:hypothetical protein